MFHLRSRGTILLMRVMLFVCCLAVASACAGDAQRFADAGADGPTSADATTDAGDDPVVDAPLADAPIDATEVDAPGVDGPQATFPDPAPGIDTPGEHGGTSCPDSNQTSFTLSIGAASTHTFSGQITGAVGDGEFWVSGPSGETVGGPIETAANGSYAKTLPIFCGANLVKLVWNNGTCPLVLVYAVDRATCVTADITATVQWDDQGLDWELHLIKPGGRINDPATDCTWTTCISASPDWGVVGDTADNPHKDIDNTGTFGPENIWLAGPETGRYTVMVEHWGGGLPSAGFVTLNVGGQVHTVNITGLVSRHVWTAATIDWPAGTVTTTQSTYDCTATWSSGCTAMIP
jgi:uncharacterized protein YfaP (DUF2135 family)